MRKRIPPWLFPVAAVALCCAGCGSDYRPADLPTTGVPAGPLGQVIDLDVRFPRLRVGTAPFAGLELEMRVELDRVGYGEIPARVFYEGARLPMDTVDVQDLTDGRTTITVTPEQWTSGILGPLRVGDTTLIGFVLDGEPQEGGWRVSGRAVADQDLSVGAFEGWRRHRFLVAGTDFVSSAGRIEEVSLVRESEMRVRRRLELVSADPVLRVTEGAAFVINRFTFDNLQRLDPLRDFGTSWQEGVGAGANPQDLVLITEDKGYVTRYEPPYDDVLVFEPLRGRKLGTIPLGPYAENRDGTPRASMIRLAEGAVFVALQDIDRTFTRYAEGKLVVIDPVRDAVAGVIPLGATNPFGMDVVRDEAGREKLYVALAGIFPGQLPQELSGGVVVVDVLNRVVERTALDAQAAGGNLGGISMVDERLGYVIVSDASYVNRVLAFDPQEGTILRTVFESSDYVAEIAVDASGMLAIPNRSFFDPRTCLYRTPDDPALDETLVGCVAMELPPFSIEALD